MEDFRTIIEPFKIKMVEPIRFPDRSQRAQVLERAGWNPFRIHSRDVVIDLLTDSGTAAMSAAQWARMMEGDEAYAASASWSLFEDAVKSVTGMDQVIPVHQGRAAEALLFQTMTRQGHVVPGNGHFDTTRANIEHTGAIAVDLPIPAARQPALLHPFKGNIDIPALERLIDSRGRAAVPLIVMTVTNNTAGGQPVSMQNLREVRAVADRYGIPLYLDACRFAENAILIQMREPGHTGRRPRDIAREMFSLADGCTMSAKKDGLANIGGFLALRDPEHAGTLRNLELLTEGFPTYGGLAGRDLAAIAQGLEEVLDEDYLRYRIRSLEYLAEIMDLEKVPYLRPVGGHALYLDAARLLPHIPPSQFPGQALVGALYLEGGIRSVEVGSVMFGREDPETGCEIPHALELVRLAFPRRVYTQSHVDFVAEVIERVAARAPTIQGLKFVEKPRVLRHFTARFAPVDSAPVPSSVDAMPAAARSPRRRTRRSRVPMST